MTSPPNPHEGTVELEALEQAVERLWAHGEDNLARKCGIALRALRTPARPAPTDVEAEAVLLLGARHVLRDLHQKNPECGYGKMAAACEAAALRAPAVPREVEVIEDLVQAVSEAVEFADQDYQALTPLGREMIDRWCAAMAKGEALAALRASPTGVGMGKQEVSPSRDHPCGDAQEHCPQASETSGKERL